MICLPRIGAKHLGSFFLEGASLNLDAQHVMECFDRAGKEQGVWDIGVARVHVLDLSERPATDHLTLRSDGEKSVSM